MRRKWRKRANDGKEETEDKSSEADDVEATENEDANAGGFDADGLAKAGASFDK